MANLEVTFYAFTGYSFSDEPASDAVIDQNEHWIMPKTIIGDIQKGAPDPIKVVISEDGLRKVDYIKLRDVETGDRAYYFVADKGRLNQGAVILGIILDAFATVGLQNISFFGNIMRRSLSAAEAQNYPLLPEPWAPKRPLKVRRFILDVNTNKKLRVPSHISTTFTEESTEIEDTQVIHVPNSPLGLSTFEDSLSVSATVPMGYPNIATTTNHTISSPWGSVSYDTPYEQYLDLAGAAADTFLMKAKKYNSLDLIGQPYYLPAPAAQNVAVPEVTPTGKYPKSNRYYTVITIRSLAGNATQSYSDNDTDIRASQSIAVVVVPDKTGGIYVLPTTIRDTGLNTYTYMSGVYSPFETAVLNAVGDTPAKFASDGTVTINTALNDLFQEYIGKVNAIQYENMQAKYFKDIGILKGNVMAFPMLALNLLSEAVSVTEAHVQRASIDTAVPTTTQSSSGRQDVPYQSQRTTGTTTVGSHKQQTNTSVPGVNGTVTGYTDVGGYSTNSSGYTQGRRDNINQRTHTDGYTTGATTTIDSVTQRADNTMTQNAHSVQNYNTTTNHGYNQHTDQNTTIPEQVTKTTTRQDGAERSVAEGVKVAVDGVPAVYDQMPDWGTLRTLVLGSYVNEVHALMLGNINDYLNRWASIQNDMHNGKVANLFKNVTLVGSFSNTNMVAGKYEILVSSLQPEDAANFDIFLDHFGHAVDEYSGQLVADVKNNYNYTLVGEDAVVSNAVRPDLSAVILNQFRAGVRTWKTLVRPQNF